MIFVRLACLVTLCLCLQSRSDAGLHDRVAIAEAAVWAAQNQFPAAENDFAPRMTMQVANPEASELTPSPIFCQVHIADGNWCIPCNNQKATNGAGDLRVFFEYTTAPSPGSGTLPCTTYTDSTGKLRTIEGFHTTQQIWDKIQRNNPPLPVQANLAATGKAGAIQARSAIQTAIAWWRDKIGEGIKAEARWDRSGGQAFPLLANGDWSALALCGAYGHVQLSAKGAKGLPFDGIGFGYKVDGDDIVLDLDPITMKGLALRVGPTKSAASVAHNAQISPGTILTIASIARGVWMLLHPSCDLQLGGNVTATAMLVEDKITIDFQQCPSIKLVALFTFQLRVDRVELTEDVVRVMFGGSRFVKERSFAVE